MDKRMLLLLSLAAVILAASVPIAADDAEGATEGDIQLTLPGGLDTVQVTVGNGASETFTIYIYNGSADYLIVSAATESDSDLVDIDAVLSTSTLSPDSTSEWGHTATVDVTVTVDRYDDASSATGRLLLTFADMTGVSRTFTVSVGIEVDIDSAYHSADGNNKFLGAIPNTFDGILGSEWVTAIVTLVVWALIAFVVSWIVVPVFTRIFNKSASDEERRKTKKSLTSLIVLLIVVLAINQCLTILGAGPEVRDGFDTLSGILYTVIGALIAWVVYTFVITALVRGMERGSDSAIDSSLIPLFKMIGKIVIAVCAAASILAAFGVDLNGILVSAGVITLGITLGAQSVLSQFFSGIVLLSTRPFKRGDYVEINGQIYIVRKVKLMFTEFDNDDRDRVITIPNDVVSGGTIVNMTGEDSDTSIYVYVKVSYGTDLKLARELMVRAAEEHPHVINDGSRSKPSTRMTDLQDSVVELRLFAVIDSYALNGAVAGELRARIYELFSENGIDIPYSKTEVVLREPCDGRRRDGDTEAQ